MTNPLANPKLHPLTWWFISLGLAVIVGTSESVLVLFAISAGSLAAVAIWRDKAAWSKSIKFYFFIAIFVILARIFFRIVFNPAGSPPPIALNLPAVEINLGFGQVVNLFGAVSFASLEDGFVNGLRLAAIVLAIGMASSLANPRQLLKSTPSALYEIATAISVAINLAPQMISSLQRVKSARLLRGRSKGLGSMAGLIIPVLEDSIDSSLALAASMDARGFGRRGQLTRFQLLLARGSALSAIALLTIGSFLLLMGASVFAALLILAIGISSAFITVRINSSAHIRTQYKKRKLVLSDYFAIAFTAIAVGLGLIGWLP